MESAVALTTYLPTLVLISKVKNTSRRQLILDEFAKEPMFARLIRELAHNLYKKKITVSSSDRRKLIRHKHSIKTCANHKHKHRRAVIRQAGGWLNIAVPALAFLFKELIA